MTFAAPLASDPAPVANFVRSEAVPQGVRDEATGLTVPRGFKINVFAEDLDGPRRIVIAPGATTTHYDVFVAESRANRVRVLREVNGDGVFDSVAVFSDKFNQPYGIAFHPSGYLYVGDTDAVVRLPYTESQTQSNEQPQEVTQLTRGGYNQHWTRNVLFSDDSKKLYVTIGSSCNVCEESDTQRAAISVMNPDGSDRRLYASGLRNPVGLQWHDGRLWTAVNGRDWLGDNTPPDTFTAVRDGGFYGWPYAYTDLKRKVTADPDFGGKAPDKVKATLPATVPVQAHSAALGLAFYPKNLPQGAKPFPAEYQGSAFLAYHGSWNRDTKTGYKIVRVAFKNGSPTSITDFVTGFLNGTSVSGRPVDVAVAPDGALLFSDDQGGKVWRVSREE